MKTKIILLSLSIISFVLLLFHQIPGINFLIYGCIMVALSFTYYKSQSTERYLIAASIIVSCFAVAYYGPGPWILLSLLAFCLLPVYNVDPKTPFIFSPILSGLSYVLSFLQIPQILKDTGAISTSHKVYKLAFYILIPLVVLSIFLVIYANVNTQFGEIFEKLNFKDFDPEFLAILFLACFFSVGFWYYKNWFATILDKIPLENSIQRTSIINTETDKIKLNSGIILFALLNISLMVLLGFEFNESYVGQSASSPSNLSQNVHLSVFSVIVSILLAILLITIYLDGKLNFIKNSNILKNLIYVWIGLNFLLLLNSFFKNQLYISNLGLTEKRLGVIAFLLLSIMGLFLTTYKVYRNKSTYYLFNSVAWTIFLFLVAIQPLNWSKFITKYNIHLYEEKKVPLDVVYLERLDYNVTEMVDLQSKHPELFPNRVESQKENFERNQYPLENCENFLSQNFYNYITHKQLQKE